MGNLNGKTILVTGATSGIGLEAAVVFALQGARLVLIGRDPERTAKALAQVKARGASELVDSFLCDFSSQKQIRALAPQVLAKYPRIDVLLNNAGLVNDKRTVTEDGIEATFAVNHLGYFLFTQLMLDAVKAAAPSRIVNVASAAQYGGTMDFEDLGFERGGYGVMKAYGRSKLANVMFTRALAKRLEGTGVTVNSLHPGAVATNIWSRAPWFTKPFLAVLKPLMVSPQKGGQRLVYAATSPELEGKTGLYLNNDKPAKLAPLAQDDAVNEKLWAVSQQLTSRAEGSGA